MVKRPSGTGIFRSRIVNFRSHVDCPRAPAARRAEAQPTPRQRPMAVATVLVATIRFSIGTDPSTQCISAFAGTSSPTMSGWSMVSPVERETRSGHRARPERAKETHGRLTVSCGDLAGHLPRACRPWSRGVLIQHGRVRRFASRRSDRQPARARHDNRKPVRGRSTPAPPGCIISRSAIVSRLLLARQCSRRPSCCGRSDAAVRTHGKREARACDPVQTADVPKGNVAFPGSGGSGARGELQRLLRIGPAPRLLA